MLAIPLGLIRYVDFIRSSWSILTHAAATFLIAFPPHFVFLIDLPAEGVCYGTFPNSCQTFVQLPHGIDVGAQSVAPDQHHPEAVLFEARRTWIWCKSVKAKLFVEGGQTVVLMFYGFDLLFCECPMMR
jgi:hypothetical protein